MFIKNLKLKAIFLAVVMIGLGVISGKAEDPTFLKITDEETKVDTTMKNFINDMEKDPQHKMTVWVLKQFFKEKEEQRAELLKCCSLGNSPENGHPELYYLWLKQKYEEILPEFALGAEIRAEIDLFMKHLQEAANNTHSVLAGLYVFSMGKAYDLLTSLRDGSIGRYTM
jgi:hypothetical protein